MNTELSAHQDTALPPVALLDNLDATRAVLSSERQRLLLLLSEPHSATALAEKLGESRQRIGYHVRALAKAGLVETVSTRRRGNCVEQILRARARRFVLTAGALGELGNLEALESETIDNPVDTFSWAHLVRSAARMLRDLALLRRRAVAENRSLPTFTIDSEVRFTTPADFERFATEMSDAVASVVARFHDEDSETGRTFRLVVASHPTATAHTLHPSNTN